MIKSLGPGLDSLDFLRIALGNQHLFIVIQNSNLSKPLVLTWPQLLQQIQAQLNINANNGINVQDEGSVIQSAAQFLNFIGGGVTVTPSATGVDIVIPGGGSAAEWGSIGAGTGVGSQADLVAYLTSNYQPIGNYVPTSRNLTINGVTYDLSADRSWTITSGVYTADNGLTMLSNNVALGSSSAPGAPLLNNRYIDTGSTFGLYLQGQKTNQNDAVLFINNTASGGTGLRVDGSGSSLAIRGESSSGQGVYGISNTSVGILGQTSATGQGAILASVTSAASNLIALGLRIRHVTSASPVAGLGVSIDFRGGTTINGEVSFGRLMYQWTDAVTASRTSKFQIETVNGATGSIVTSVKLEVLGSGQLVLNQYTTGTSFASGLTSVGVLNVDNTGKVFVGPGGGVPTTRKIDTTHSLTGGGDLSADRTLSLVNDQASPGANKVYGTDSSGTKGWKADPSGGGGLKSGTATQVSPGVYTTTIAGVTSYTAGDTYIIKFDSVNDGDSTLNILGVGVAVPMRRNTDVKLNTGAIKANQEITVVYDGTNFQLIGLVNDQILAYVHNAEGAIISKGQAVYAYQATGGKMSVKLARADSDATSAKTIGLVYDSSIGIGGEGYIITQGVIEGVNTAAFSAGDTLYLSGTTFGAYTATPTYAPTHRVYVGIVERANTNGQIFVRCQNGYELDEIHDVALKSPYQVPANNDVLTYITGTPNLWQARSVSSLLPTSVKTGSFGVTVDGVTTVVQVGQVGYVVMPYDGTITRWTITSNVSGSISFDIWKDASIDTIPTIGDSIVGGVYPLITGTNFGTSTNLTSWTSTTFSAGHIFGFYVNSASTIKNATLTLRVTKS